MRTIEAVNRISDDTLVYIHTELIDFTIKGRAEHPAFSGVGIQEQMSSLSASCRDGFEMATAKTCSQGDVCNKNEWQCGSYLVQPLFFEQQRYEIVLESKAGLDVSFWHENINIRKQISPVGRQGTIQSGIINFGNDIGMSDFVIMIDGREYLKLTVEVFPSKLSYRDDYQAIVTDVMSEVYNLIFDFMKKTYSSFDTSEKLGSSLVEFFAIISKIYSDFVRAADIVLNRPHHLLATEYNVLPSHKVKRVDNKAMRWLLQHPHKARRIDGRIVAEQAMTARKYVTYNTKENQLVKYMLLNTVKRLDYFRRLYLKLDRQTDEVLLKKIQNMVDGINRRISTGFMMEVEAEPGSTGMSLVFGMAPGYKDMYRLYLLLQRGLSVTGTVFSLSEKNLAELYEYWCFIKLNSIMRSRYQLLSQDVLKTSGQGLFVTLKKGATSRVKYRNTKNNEVITLAYNPKKTRQATVTQKPDNVLSLQKTGSEEQYEYVFDAKYKINPALPGTDYCESYGTPGPQEEDINTMHRYRDAIVYQHGESPYARTMFGAYVLFPYSNQEEYRQHKFYTSINKVNIGGLPFLPSATTLVENMLDELIADSPASAFERATLPVGIEKKLAKVDWSRRDVLIGTFRSRQQFHVCYEKRFYYIPARELANDVLPIRYVALYQTIAKFDSEAGIRFLGEVLRTDLVKRKNIRELPVTGGNPEEPYYRFQVREWKELDKVIKPKESGFVREFTNLFLLENMEYVQELLIKSALEYRLYTELKRRTGMSIKDGDAGALGNGFELERDGIKVMFVGEDIVLCQHEQEIGRCNIKFFSRYPSASFRSLQKGLR